MDNTRSSNVRRKRKKVIVDTAYEMFLENGISATSMNDIAEKCEISRRTIYNYFDNKTDLLCYLMNRLTDKIDDEFHLDYNKDKTGLENLSLLLRTNFKSYYKYMKEFHFIAQVRIYISYIEPENLRNKQLKRRNNIFVNEIEEILEKGLMDDSIKIKEFNLFELSQLIYQTLYGFLTNITLNEVISKKKYYDKCNKFEYMIIEFLK